MSLDPMKQPQTQLANSNYNSFTTPWNTWPNPNDYTWPQGIPDPTAPVGPYIPHTWTSGLASMDALSSAFMKCSNNEGGKIRSILTEVVAECKYSNPDTNLVFDIAGTKVIQLPSTGITMVDTDVIVLDGNTPDEYLDRYCDDIKGKFYAMGNTDEKTSKIKFNFHYKKGAQNGCNVQEPR